MPVASEIRNTLFILGFSPQEGSVGIWTKNYANHNYRICVDFDKKEFDYGEKITLGDRTTCNFNASENFVVLECVNRLLEKGYPPDNITLEKDYPLGHKTKGKLDILVTDSEDKAFLMIECKSWGTEYEKATKKTLGTGGQLLSYFQQDKSAKFLCLYTSKIENKIVQFKYGVIKIEPEYASAANTEEVFELWNKNLKDNGIFESSSTPYKIIIKSLTKDRLIPLTKDDSSRIFNQFAEILRHNVVSDKPNAFNKLITLLLCKIVDEDRSEGEELHFQWLETDTNITLQKRLNDLYKIGMERYLTKVVTDYSDQNVEEIVGLNDAQKDLIKHIITELRLKKNNEFAFKEVFNDASFEENSKVLREVVELFQPYQVRYNKKHQFLGDFFELLLNTSIKQEAGQFFTPVPVARFIVNSLPLKELMINKITKGDSDFIPYVIDYAVGSGHFLTEAMDEIHNILKDLHQFGKFSQPSVKRNLSKWSEDYDWAYDFIYGIEKDYRLVKTAKVSCFLNGDGLARIFNADGLGSFKHDSDYRDKLKEISKYNARDNQQFEILVANPPYSVSAFKNTLKHGDESFDLYNRLTDESSEIECLFIERAKQLLKDGGYAGIILPSSILSNGGIYEASREVLLKYFNIIAVTEFGSGTFMATGTNTVALFLQRRNNFEWQKIEHTINSFFINTTDVSCNGIEGAFSKYVLYTYKTIGFEDYASFIKKTPNQNLLNHELFKDYRYAFDNSTPIKNLKKKFVFKSLSPEAQEVELNKIFMNDVIKTEKEKILYFILVYSQKTLLIKSNPTGKNESEKEFLGYEFSSRRGHEGIKAYGAKTIQEATKLYDENNPLNPDKVNSYIYNAFLGQEKDIAESLSENISTLNLVDMLNFESINFSKSISLASKKKTQSYSKWPLVKLGTIAEILGGGTPDTSLHEYWNGDVNWATLVDTKEKYLYNTERKITELGLKNCNATLLPINTVIFSSRATIGDVTIAKIETATNQGYKNFVCDLSKIDYEYLYYILKREANNISELCYGATYLEISKSQISEFKIPLPPLDVQTVLSKKLSILDNQEVLINEQKQKLINEVKASLKNHNSNPVAIGKISENLDYLRKPVSKNRRTKGIYPYYGASGLIDYVNSFVVEGPILLVSEDGANLKSRRLPIAFSVNGKVWVNNHAHILKFKNQKIQKFVEWYLNVTDLTQFITGMAQPKLNQANLTKISIQLPEETELDKIFNKIIDVEEKLIQCENELRIIESQKDNSFLEFL
jgi:type I restriction enzyme M protein